VELVGSALCNAYIIHMQLKFSKHVSLETVKPAPWISNETQCVWVADAPLMLYCVALHSVVMEKT